MSAILSFPFYGPSRRADVPVVEVRLDPRDPQFPSQCPTLKELRQRLAPQGIWSTFSELTNNRFSDDPTMRFAELLGHLALRLQQNAGHRVEYLNVRKSRFADWRILVFVEHAHADVGMASVQLAAMLLGPQHSAVASAYAQFLDYARAHAMPAGTVALAQAAKRRNLPVLYPGRPPLNKTMHINGQPYPVSALQIGQGVKRRIVDGHSLNAANSAEELSTAAEALLNDLFPEPSAARIPVVAVTGTNGKTTTTRMVAHIFRHAGLKTGLVTSEGVNLDGQQVVHDDAGSFAGHTRVLTHPDMQAAALETHHRGIVVRGFAFDDCDVGICLNVSPDHIKRGEIETMAEMEDVKAAVPERASKAAVLFADNMHCRAMANRITAETTWWVSLTQSVEELEQLPGTGQRALCTIAVEDGAEWILVQQNGARYPLMPVAELPVTFGGAARFMLSNAMHASAAALALGIAPQIVAAALSRFEAGEEMTPGRLNEIQGLPFRLILDFAHNPDGMAKLVEFTDRLDVNGRKFIALSGMGKRDDVINQQAAEATVGHFDHYFCKDYTPSEPPLQRALAPFMQQALIEAGIEPEKTTLLTYGKQVLFDILDTCAPGDLLVYLIGNAEKAVIRDYIDEFRESRY